MITTTDTANILYRICQAFRMPVFQEGNIDKGKIGKDGRVVIHVKEQTSESKWKKGFVEINFFVADIRDGVADLIRLNELERKAHKILNVVGRHDGLTYKSTVASSVVMEEKTLNAHFVNVKVLFRVMNVME